MANNRRRRRRRRKALSLKRSETQEIPRLRGVLQKVPGWVWAVTAGLAVVVSLLQGYPWISIDSGGQLDEHNPYSTLFLVENDGYLPVTDLNALCHATPVDISGDVHIGVLDYSDSDFAKFLNHSQKVTVPCFNALALGGTSSLIGDGELTVTISYFLYPLSWQFLRRHQQFRFKSIRGRDGVMYWMYMN